MRKGFHHQEREGIQRKAGFLEDHTHIPTREGIHSSATAQGIHGPDGPSGTAIHIDPEDNQKKISG